KKTLKKDFTKISARGSFFNARAGAGLGELLKEAAKNNLAGLDFLSGIPGTVGAAVCLNSGTADSYIGDLIQTVTLFNSENMEINILKKQDAGFSYRKSDIGKNNIITGCELCLKRGVKSDIINNYRKNLIQKKINQPLDKKSCGCIFKNPKNSDFTAGQLIDKAGFKGKTTGGAEVSMKHANFITNRGNASSRDIYSLIDEIYKGVKGKFGVELELELKLLGYEK
ncbi:MAG: UDP-N-acetylmuramate dehydrogenase, partial [Elusimicrobia bacterium]|nr:UDP-N-acetylmuramate dehydrogenase [Elusimicrobiota bacterium]